MDREARLRLISLLLGLAVATAGCHAHHKVDKEELVKLDGFRAGDEVLLTDLYDREIVYTWKNPIVFVLEGDDVVGNRYAGIDLEDGTFVGTRTDGEIVRISLDEVETIAISILSGKRVFAYTMIPVGTILLLLLTGLFLFFAAPA